MRNLCRYCHWVSSVAFIAILITVVLHLAAVAYVSAALWCDGLDRLWHAAKAATAEDVAEDLSVVLGCLQRHGMTHGHAALVIDAENNNMAAIYQLLESYRDRARTLSDASPRTRDYYAGMSDLRSLIVHLPVMQTATYWWYVHTWCGRLLALSAVFSVLAWIVAEIVDYCC